jgi:menaquinone-specific isochorismate synthase
MSSPGSSPQDGTAWLRDDHSGRALRITARASDARGFAFFAPDFALSDPTPWFVGEETNVPAAAPRPRPLPALTHRVDPSATDFARTVEDILIRIERDEFRKVVPIVHEDLRFAEPVRAAMFPRAFAPAPEHQFAFGFDDGVEGACGFTPELLFEYDGDLIRSMALAGTGRADGPNLLHDPKERREHQLVIDHVGEALAGWGDVEVGDTQERVYGRLKHLYTPIQVRANRQPNFMELALSLHPTAALGGYPRRAAVEWLRAQAFHAARGRFGAPFGYLDGEKARCVVAIRGLAWHGPRLRIAAGCGIVAGSQVEREWRELELKRAAIYDHMGLSL